MTTLQCPIHLPSDVLEELGTFTGYFWPDFRLEPVIGDAIRAYMQPAPPAQQQQQQQRAAADDTGYQWKQLFLAQGTRLRASFGGTAYFAVVDGAEIKHADRAISPSGFANLHGSGNRNAWKAIWLRFPGSEQWVLADVCRALQKAGLAQLFGNQTPETKAALPSKLQATLQATPQPTPQPAENAPAQPVPKSSAGRHAKRKKRHGKK
jgi:hypothetical protein